MRFETQPILFFYQSNFIKDNWLFLTILIIFVVILFIVIEIHRRKRSFNTRVNLNRFANENNGKFYRSKDTNSPTATFTKEEIDISLTARTNRTISGESDGDGTELMVYFQTNLLDDFSLQMKYSENFLIPSFCKTNHASLPELFLSPSIKKRFEQISYTEVSFGLPVLSSHDMPKYQGLKSSNGFLFIRIYLKEYLPNDNNKLVEFAWMCYGRLKEISTKPELLEKLKANYKCCWCGCASDTKKDLCINCNSDDPHRN